MSISLNTIRYFVAAAKYENFSKAANELYTAQPNLSKRIAELERTIGVRLFRRTGKQVRLTEAGGSSIRNGPPRWIGSTSPCVRPRRCSRSGTTCCRWASWRACISPPLCPSGCGSFKPITQM